jgi:hypothetical protein
MSLLYGNDEITYGTKGLRIICQPKRDFLTQWYKLDGRSNLVLPMNIGK